MWWRQADSFQKFPLEPAIKSRRSTSAGRHGSITTATSLASSVSHHQHHQCFHAGHMLTHKLSNTCVNLVSECRCSLTIALRSNIPLYSKQFLSETSWPISWLVLRKKSLTRVLTTSLMGHKNRKFYLAIFGNCVIRRLFPFGW